MQKLLHIRRHIFFILCLPFMVVGLLFLSPPSNAPEKDASLATHAAPTASSSGSTGTENTSAAPPVAYSKQGVALMKDKLRNPQPLTNEDLAIRKRLIASLKGKSGVLKKTTAYTLEYILGPDEFMVTIKDMDIGKAKNAAVDWFTTEGISLTGVCNLPVVFILDGNVARQIKPLNMTFNPLPDYCY